MTRKPMWSAEAIKAYESGQGVKLVNIPHPHYEPLPKDLNPESLETVEIEVPEPPQRQWVGLTDEEILDVNMSTVTKLIDEPIICDTDHNIIQFARAIEAKLKEKNNA